MIYQSSPSLQVCQGTYAWVDNFVPFVARELGLDVARVQVYRWLDSFDFEGADCPSQTAGCTHGSQASSLKPFLLHELVHTVLATLDYPYQPFFGEGIAYALDPWTGSGLGPIYVASSTGQGLPDPRPWMTMARNDLNYSMAGSFVMFLLARHGPTKFLEFTRELGTSRDMNVIERSFRITYGLELNREAELFMEGVPCTSQFFNPAVYDCMSPNVPWEGDQWSLSGVMDCGSDDVVGGFGPDESWASIRSVTLDVPTSGQYYLRAESDGEIRVRIGPCSRCPWADGGVTIYSAPEPIGVELAAGTHYVRIQALSDKTPGFDIVLSQ